MSLAQTESDYNCGIYSITSPSGKKYIGSSKNLSKRWVQHQWFLKNGNHCNRHLQSAWNKYQGQLVFSSIIICSPENLILYEQQALDTLKPEYNISKSASKGFYALGVKRSDETRAKISKALTGKNTKGHPQSEESKLKLSKALIGNKNGLGNKANLNKKLSKETCLKMSLARKGKPIPESQRIFLSESRKGSGNPMFGKTPWNKKNVT